MKPAARKSLLTVHVICSVGWLGAVGAFLAMNIVGLTSSDSELARAMFRAMNVAGLYVIVPASIGCVASGILQGVWTQWGLLRHRWVAIKLLIGVFATILLLLHQFTAVAEAASRAERGVPVGALGVQLVFDSSLAVAALLFATGLSTFKPWGQVKTRPGKLVLIVVVAVLVLMVVKHVAGGGMHHH
jgi:hypothetical protein